ncbi:MAG: hypothetical protein EON58_12605, partial [Alphaproteobacteria bacterium]
MTKITPLDGVWADQRPTIEQPPFGTPNGLGKSREIEESVAGQGLLNVLARHMGLMSLVVTLVCAITASIVAFQRPGYTAVTLILINPAPNRIIAEQKSLSQGLPDSAFVDSEIEVLRSADLLRRLDENLHPAATTAEQAVSLQELTNSIAIKRRDLTFVIEVSATAKNPGEAARIANGLVDLYLASQKESRQAAADEANGWLGDGLEQLKAEMQQRETAVQEYRGLHGLTKVAGVPVKEQQLAEIQRLVLSAKAEFAERNARYEQVRGFIDSGASPDTLAGALNSEIIRDLRNNEAKAAQNVADLNSRYGASHPALLRGQSELNTARTQIKLEIDRIVANLRDEAQVSRARLSTLEASLRQSSEDVVSSNSDLARLNQLESEAVAARNVYEELLQRSHEVARQGNLPTINARVIAKAQAPNRPSSPNWLLAAVGAVFGGFALALVAAFLAEQTRRGLYTVDDVKARVGYPLIASVPRLSRKEMRSASDKQGTPSTYLARKQFSAFAEAFRVFRASLQWHLQRSGSHVIAITSAIPNEGKTTLAFSLGRIWALSGQKVIIVDCDIRRRSLSSLVGTIGDYGLCEILADGRPWKNAVVSDRSTPLAVLPASPLPYTPEDLFDTARMDELMADLSSVYDVVILDCAPVLVLAESTILAKHAGTVAVVCHWGKTPVKLVEMAIDNLRSTGARIAGIAFNNVDPSAPQKGLQHGAPYVSKQTKAY